MLCLYIRQHPHLFKSSQDNSTAGGPTWTDLVLALRNVAVYSSNTHFNLDRLETLHDSVQKQHTHAAVRLACTYRHHPISGKRHVKAKFAGSQPRLPLPHPTISEQTSLERHQPNQHCCTLNASALAGPLYTSDTSACAGAVHPYTTTHGLVPPTSQSLRAAPQAGCKPSRQGSLRAWTGSDWSCLLGAPGNASRGPGAYRTATQPSLGDAGRT